MLQNKLDEGRNVLADLKQLATKAQTSHMRRLLDQVSTAKSLFLTTCDLADRQEQEAFDFQTQDTHVSDSKKTDASSSKETVDICSSDSDGDGENSSGDVSDPEETEVREADLRDRLERCRSQYGMENGKTMDVTFKLLNCMIGQYKLNQTEELVTEIMPICVKNKEEHSKWYIKAIQSLGFCKYKQYKFREALDLFLEQESIIGPSSALCENIGHTQSSLGLLQDAEASFEKGVEMLKMGSFGNKGGIYLGLGLVRERLGRNKEALSVLLQVEKILN